MSVIYGNDLRLSHGFSQPRQSTDYLALSQGNVYFNGRAFAGVLINNCNGIEEPSGNDAVGYQIHRPFLARPFRGRQAFLSLNPRLSLPSETARLSIPGFRSFLPVRPGYNLVQALILLVHSLQLLELTYGKTCVLGFPVVVSGVAHPVLAAESGGL